MSGRSITFGETTRLTSLSPPSVRCVVAAAMYGTTDEVRPARRRMSIGKDSGGDYLGDEISQGDWASRHDRYATPLHGRPPKARLCR